MKTYTAEEFAEFTKKDLVVYGRMNYGLTLSQAMDKHELIEQLLQAQKKFSGNENILVLKDTDEETEVPPGHVKVRVQPGKYNPKGRPVIASHQFNTFSIPVNRDVIIPNHYLACLEYAVRREHVQDGDTGDMIAQDVHAYPFSIIERGPKLEKKKAG